MAVKLADTTTNWRSREECSGRIANESTGTAVKVDVTETVSPMDVLIMMSLAKDLCRAQCFLRRSLRFEAFQFVGANR